MNAGGHDRPPRRGTRHTGVTWLDGAAVALGVVPGALARWALLGLDGAAFPWALLVANVLGCAVMGAAVITSRPDRRTLALTVGFCGGLTSFSTWAVDTAALTDDGRYWLAAANVVGTLAFSAAAFAAGRRLLRTPRWA